MESSNETLNNTKWVNVRADGHNGYLDYHCLPIARKGHIGEHACVEGIGRRIRYSTDLRIFGVVQYLVIFSRISGLH